LDDRIDNDDDDDDEEDDDDYIDTDSLGDWRNFRRSLAMLKDTTTAEVSSAESTKRSVKASTKLVSKENQELLKSQNEELHQEFKTGVWAHETSTVSWLLLNTSIYKMSKI
jgi:hypothetical protein